MRCRKVFIRGYVLLAAGAAGGLLAAQPASAQARAGAQAMAADERRFDLPAAALGTTLNRIVTGSGMVVSVDPALVQGKVAPAIAGTMSAQEALRRTLEGSGLELAQTPSGAWTVRRAPVAAGAAVLEPVTVHGNLLDPGVTEDTQSYTTPALSIGKVQTSLRELPQSVSVVTRRQLDEQNANSLGDAMNYVTGLRVNPTGTGVVNLESRGYRMENYLIDGLPAKGGQGMWASALMDMGLYDRVEVWRGPAGLLEGAGEPSGTINMVRKRAQSEFAFRGAVSAGSWDRYRAEADLTGPLNESGTLRGRLVGIYDDQHSFIDYVWQRNTTVYGTLEYDFTPNTTLSIGGSNQNGGSLVFVGLPLLPDGKSPDVGRSTFLGSKNGVKDDDAYSYFAELEHRMDNGGRMKLSARQYVRETRLDRFMTHSFIDPQTRTVTVRGTRQRSREDDRGLDAFVSMPVAVGGLRQEFLAGANYQIYRGGQTQGRHTAFTQNVDDPDLDLHLPEEDIGGPPKTRVTQYGVYGQARIKPWQPLTVVLGGRLAWWKTTDPDDPGSDQSIKGRFVPNVGIIGDLNEHLSVYGSFNRIFAPQTEQSVDGGFLAPRVGKQYEVGLKGEFFDKQLNTHLAFFRIEDSNRALVDPDNEDYSIAAGKVRSQGLEAEISGRITPQWDLTAGYAYTATKYLEASADQRGRPFNESFPRHVFTLWTKYRLAGDWLHRVSVGGGVRAYSRSTTTYDGVSWTQDPYVVASAQLGYEVNKNVQATLTVNNLFDRRYFARLAGHEYRQTYYGEPRNVMLTLRGRF